MNLEAISPTAAEAVAALFVCTVYASGAHSRVISSAADRLVGYGFSLDQFASIRARTTEDSQGMGLVTTASRVAAPLRLHLSPAIRQALLGDLSRTAATAGITATAAAVLGAIRDAWQ